MIFGPLLGEDARLLAGYFFNTGILNHPQRSDHFGKTEYKNLRFCEEAR